MAGDLLLDTTAVIGLFNKDAAVVAKIGAASQVLVPSAVIGELYYGAFKSWRAAQNTARVDAFVAGNTVVPCDTATARAYGLIKNELRQSGRPIPENDMWVAAVARQHGLTLLTRDQHFGFVKNLTVETW